MIKCKGKNTICNGSVVQIAEDFSNICAAVMKYYDSKYDPETSAKIVASCIRCAMAVNADDDDAVRRHMDELAEALATIDEDQIKQMKNR